MNTSDDGNVPRRRRRQHSAEFKAKVVSACRKPGISMAAVALANKLNANLLRRWVVAEERAQPANPIETVSAAPARLPVENVHSDPDGELCSHGGAEDQDRVAAWGDGGEG